MGYSQEVKASDFDSDNGGSNPPSPAKFLYVKYYISMLTSIGKSSNILLALKFKWWEEGPVAQSG